MASFQLELCAGTILQAESLAAKAEAASRAGFGTISLWYQDYAGARATGMSDRDIRALLDDHGLVVNETEVLANWAPTIGASAVERSAYAGMLDLEERQVMAMASCVGARSVTAVELLGAPVDLGGAAEAFAGLCDRANELGLCVNLEFLPFSGIPDLASARRIVKDAGRPNGGLVIDSWHLFRAGTDLGQLEELSASDVNAIQLSDAPASDPGDARAETGSGRLLPGEGDMDLVGIVRHLDAIGAKAPIGVEVFSSRLRALDPVDVAILAMESLQEVVARAGVVIESHR